MAAGLVATNAHNLRERTTAVTFADGRVLQGELAGADVEGDLAVLKVDTGDAPAVGLGGASEAGEVASPWPGPAPAAPAGPSAWCPADRAGVPGAPGPAHPRQRRAHRPLPRGVRRAARWSTPQGKVVGLSTHRIGDGFYLALPDRRASSGAASTAWPRAGARSAVTLGVGLAPAGVARQAAAVRRPPDHDGLLVRGVEDGSPADRRRAAPRATCSLRRRPALTAADDLFEVLDGVGVWRYPRASPWSAAPRSGS